MKIFTETDLKILAWVLGAFVVAFTCGRYVIRYREFKRMQLDDLLHGLAFSAWIVFLSLYTCNFSYAINVEAYLLTSEQTPPSEEIWQHYMHYNFGVVVLFWVIFYSVKLSFLALYYKIFSISSAFRKVFWTITVFTIVSFVISLLGTLWFCGKPELLFRAGILECFSSEVLDQLFILTCTLNVTSDLAIMALPIWVLWRLQMSLSHKLGLGAIFSLAIFIVVIDILRVWYTVAGLTVALDMFLDIIETCTAVIVSTLPTYSSLLRKERSMPESLGTQLKPISSLIRPSAAPDRDTGLPNEVYNGASLSLSATLLIGRVE